MRCLAKEILLSNANNVDTTGQSANKILRYDGSNWLAGPQIMVTIILMYLVMVSILQGDQLVQQVEV